MSDPYVLLNGEFIPASQASLPVGDLALQRGYGIFDFLRTIQGRPLFLDDHLDRLYRSASFMRLPIAKSRAELRSLLDALIHRNGLSESGVRITVTGGISDDGYSITTPNLLVTEKPLMPAPPGIAGIRLMTYPHRRQLPHVKTLDYLMAIWLQPLLREKGADDVLYERDGFISECPRSSFFLVTRNNTLVTPGSGILEGVIRKHVLQLATESNSTEVRDVRLDEIAEAREAFVTSTTKHILPVLAINGRPIGNAQPGDTTSRLGEMLARRIHTGAH